MKRLNSGPFMTSLISVLPPNVGTVASKKIFPLTDFYDTPESFFTTGQPGDLIRSMKFDGYNLPEGVRRHVFSMARQLRKGILSLVQASCWSPLIKH